MKIVIQRVTSATCRVLGNITGTINHGYVVFTGFADGDNEDDFNYIINKLSKIRLFENDEGKIHYNIKQLEKSILAIPQFTLYANTTKGNRPDFLQAMKPTEASAMFDRFVETLRNDTIHVETGIFGADMQIEAHNDGPFTIIIDSSEKK